MYNLDRLLRLFSDWSIGSLVYGAGGFFTIFLIQELIFHSLIKKNRSQKPEVKKVLHFFYFHLLCIFRVFVRFELLYLFLRIVKHSPGPQFPWSLVYGAVSSIILTSGIFIPVYMLLNLGLVFLNSKAAQSETEKSQDPDPFIPEQSEEGEQTLKVGLAHNRGLKFTLFFLSFSIVMWNILGLLPVELETSEIVRTGLLLNGLVISCLILMVVQKIFKTTLAVLEGAEETERIIIIVRSLSKPVQFITLACILIWFKQMVLEIPGYANVLDKMINLFFLAAVILFIFQFVEILGMRLSSYSDQDTNNVDKTFVELLRMIIRISIILAGVFSAVQIITGKPLTALLAGLGIGGLAVALAAQDTLKNFFGSIMIMTDKPFKIGERVHVNEYDGTIEAIGFRSTRIRTLVGHQVIIPNEQMASSSIENIGRRPHIRRLTNITVTYGTTLEKMEQALDIIKNILDNHEGMHEDYPPRVYFNEYNPDSLNILMLFWYFPPDYWKFMEFSERVNFRIMKEFSEAGIEFAFPTTTTVLEQPDGQSLRFSMENKEVL
jgi:small-conductance mechanosensitive channel